MIEPISNRLQTLPNGLYGTIVPCFAYETGPGGRVDQNFPGQVDYGRWDTVASIARHFGGFVVTSELCTYRFVHMVANVCIVPGSTMIELQNVMIRGSHNG
eukprot:scaffold113022_cov17-Prasinocladus_malaysianus.AAC.1